MGTCLSTRRSSKPAAARPKPEPKDIQLERIRAENALQRPPSFSSETSCECHLREQPEIVVVSHLRTTETDTRTFPQFTELPIEIQLLIWTFAAEPTDNLRQWVLSRIAVQWRECSTHRSFIRSTTPINGRRWVQRAAVNVLTPANPQLGNHRGLLLPREAHGVDDRVWLFVNMKRAREIALSRQTLMATCRFSRQMVLEQWVREIRAINITPYVMMDGNRKSAKEVVRREVLDLLAGLLEALDEAWPYTLHTE